MPLMRTLVLALFVAGALAFPKTVSDRLAELEQKVKIHELEQRVESLQASTVKKDELPKCDKSDDDCLKANCANIDGSNPGMLDDMENVRASVGIDPAPRGATLA